MQGIAHFWTVFSLNLAALFLFGCVYAWFVRWDSKKKNSKLRDKTAAALVVGVLATLILMIPTVGIENIGLIFAGFAAAGLPMYLEYNDRISTAHQKDLEESEKIAKKYLEQ